MQAYFLNAELSTCYTTYDISVSSEQVLPKRSSLKLYIEQHYNSFFYFPLYRHRQSRIPRWRYEEAEH